ncbi:glycosyltransferase family 2 protein [Chryseobacterium oryzae]|uniref:Glycosyltransferase family 2 protein n=1 Tax=Chryseobacterium oryzae TaxID=2929799 RepID=A0ABY4BDI5_9FLAO|nr:glycosyltransferase family 2 protein [Chryseobacterium oryzae]UOE37219.1 glycosyltransferase family 2 protein [Chryseobacterium oryzae]
MKFSLITATLGRVSEIEELLISLSAQTYRSFELILVDQNPHRLIEEIVQRYDSQFTIIYIRSDRKGLSYNRNIALDVATGEIVGYPDDDCTYSENVLEDVKNSFTENNFDFVLLKANDPITDFNFITVENRILSKKDIIKKCISYNVFTKLNKNINFDVQLGVGSFFGSGEETDYMWAVLNDKSRGGFAKNATVYHPANLSSKDSERAYKYGLGFGAIFKKEYLRTKKLSVLLQFYKYLLRSAGGILLSGNKKFYYKTLIGRIKGYLNFRIN